MQFDIWVYIKCYHFHFSSFVHQYIDLAFIQKAQDWRQMENSQYHTLSLTYTHAMYHKWLCHCEVTI